MMRAIRRGIVRAVAAALLMAAVVALPWALVTFVGWPLPRHVPTTAELSRWLTSPLGDDAVLNLLCVAAWLLWAAFLPAVVTEAVAARRGRPVAASVHRAGNPLRLAAATLITAITLGTLTAAGAVATATPVAASATLSVSQAEESGLPAQLAAWAAISAAAPRQGPATFLIGPHRYTHVVERGDTLSGIARAWLGDSTRWPQICTLNWHRHWAGLGGSLTDCDLIYPGWTLRLPDDATPPAGASPAPSAGSQSNSSQAGGSGSGVTSSPGAPITAPGQDAAPGPAATSTRVVPASPAASEAASSSASPTPRSVPVPSEQGPAPSAPAATGPSAPDNNSAPATHPDNPSASKEQDGVTLPGGFVPWSLAGSVAAAVALVWLQRRRRHQPGQADDDPTDLPQPVSHLHRAVARRSNTATDADLAERAADVPTQVAFPPGGVGLVGPGAHAAARGALAAVLSSGGPRDPDHRGEAVIDGTTLTTLIGADAAALGPWPRLHVADHLEHALVVVEEMLMHRARVMDDHSATDLDALRADAPDEEPLPPVLLITDSPGAGTRMRVKTALALGADVQVTAILLGSWDHGLTVHVDADGHTRSPSPADTLPDTVPDRVAVLDTDAAVAILATLREAHTGRRPAIHLSTGAVPTTPDALPTPLAISPADDKDQAPPATGRSDNSPDTSAPEAPDAAEKGAPGDEDTAADAVADDDTEARADDADVDAPPHRKARLRVLGIPDILDVTEPGKPLRAKSLELAVFLACHPDGADARGLGEHLQPGVRLRNADVRMHTNVYNLRQVFGRATGPLKMGYVTKTAGRYQLDPATVDVDLWTFRALISQAALAPPEPRRDLLRRACDLYLAPLADGYDYEWIEPHREKVRQEASAAHILLAESLLPDEPQEAADLLDRAIRLDAYNEELYRLAMRARHLLGDRDGVRQLLRALTVALADLDAEPEESTVELARQLRSARSSTARPDVTE